MIRDYVVLFRRKIFINGIRRKIKIEKSCLTLEEEDENYQQKSNLELSYTQKQVQGNERKEGKRGKV